MGVGGWRRQPKDGTGSFWERGGRLVGGQGPGGVSRTVASSHLLWIQRRIGLSVVVQKRDNMFSVLLVQTE